MKQQVIAKVYAKAFLEIGEERKINLADELTLLTETINKSNSLENILFMDVFTREEKKAVFGDIAAKLNLSPFLVESIKFLVDEKRIGLLPLIVKEIIVLDDDKKGFIKGTIEGPASEIDQKSKDQIVGFLKEKLKKEPTLNYVQNSSLTAGYRITVEDFQLDASIDSQLEKLKTSVVSE